MFFISDKKNIHPNFSFILIVFIPQAKKKSIFTIFDFEIEQKLFVRYGRVYELKVEINIWIANHICGRRN